MIQCEFASSSLFSFCGHGQINIFVIFVTMLKKKNTSCKLYILLLDVNFLLFWTCDINFLLPFALLPVKLCHGRLEMISFRFSTPMELHPILLFIGYHCCLFGMIY